MKTFIIACLMFGETIIEDPSLKFNSKQSCEQYIEKNIKTQFNGSQAPYVFRCKEVIK